jgi:hypothetical protein
MREGETALALQARNVGLADLGGASKWRAEGKIAASKSK